MINIQENLADGTHLYGWKSEPPLTPFAPSYTHYFTEKKIFSEKECEEWNTFLVKIDPTLFDFEYDNIMKLDFHLIPELKTKIYDGIKTILSVSDNSNWQETIYAHCWFNVKERGVGHIEHSHGYHKDSFYGFHLIINAIETFSSFYHPIKFQNEAFHVPNKIGYLTLYPYYIPHGVSPNKHETPRISMAGDIFPSTWLNPDLLERQNMVEIGTYNNNNELQETK